MSTIANNDLLAAALVGYQAQLAEVEGKVAEIRAQLGGRRIPASTDGSSASKPKRNMSAAGKARIIAALKKRWAAFHKEHGTDAPAKKSRGGKRKMTAAGRKAIAEATRKRWAAYRAAKAKAA